MRTAKIFKNGQSQAVRIPREFRFKGSEVHIKKTAQGVLLTEKNPWALFEEGLDELTDDFMTERNQLALQQRDF